MAILAPLTFTRMVRSSRVTAAAERVLRNARIHAEPDWPKGLREERANPFRPTRFWRHPGAAIAVASHNPTLIRNRIFAAESISEDPPNSRPSIGIPNAEPVAKRRPNAAEFCSKDPCKQSPERLD